MCYKKLKTTIDSNNSAKFLLLPLFALLSACGIAGDAGSGVNEGIVEFPIAYVKRQIPLEDDGSQIQPDIREPLVGSPGGDLYLRARASLGAEETNITGSVTNGLGDVKDVSVSYDGKTLIFSLLPEDPAPNDNMVNAKWDIYTYNIDTKVLKRVMASAFKAASFDDVSPHFLPDGRIVFSSDRQSFSRKVILDEEGEAYSSVVENRQTEVKALVLHTMDADGENIAQITFNQSHDLDPTVLSDGRIMFSRWDSIDRKDIMSLYTISPDGSNLQAYYGTHNESHFDSAGDPTLQMIKPKQLDDGRIIMLSQPFTDTFGGADIVIVDAENFVDLNVTTDVNKLVFTSSAQQKATTTDVVLDGGISTSGRYSSVSPLNDGTGRLLVSKGSCQTGRDVSTVDGVVEIKSYPCYVEPTLDEVFPSYGIWVYNQSNDTEKPVVIAKLGEMITDAVAVQPSTRPDEIIGSQIDTALETQKLGILNIRSVYDFDGNYDGDFFGAPIGATVPNPEYNANDPDSPPRIPATDIFALTNPENVSADQLPARFIRIVKAVGIEDPDDIDNVAFGPRRDLGMRHIIGYSPIHPDGSVRLKVPADIAFYFDILDKDGRRIGKRHDNWLQLKAGETLECGGCHTHDVTAPDLPKPHGRSTAEAPSAYSGALTDSYQFINTLVSSGLGPYFAVNEKETIAEIINRGPAAAIPDVNLHFSDQWTNDELPSTLVKDADIDIVYTTDPNNVAIEGLSTPAPLPAPADPAQLPDCEVTWERTCRIVINYLDHIRPILELPRTDPITNDDHTCATSGCHSFTAGDISPPKGQLDLSSRISDEEMDHIESYRELVFTDNFQEVVGNELLDVLVPDLDSPILDANGDPTFDVNGDPLFDLIADPLQRRQPPINVNAGARGSYFTSKMTETQVIGGRTLVTTVRHDNMLTPAEMRLISEWIDIGAQYFNDPFHPDIP